MAALQFSYTNEYDLDRFKERIMGRVNKKLGAVVVQGNNVEEKKPAVIEPKKLFLSREEID